MTLLHQTLDEPVTTKALTLTNMPDMEAVFVTNAATGIRPVTSVDNHKWPSDHQRISIRPQ